MVNRPPHPSRSAITSSVMSSVQWISCVAARCPVLFVVGLNALVAGACPVAAMHCYSQRHTNRHYRRGLRAPLTLIYCLFWSVKSPERAGCHPFLRAARYWPRGCSTAWITEPFAPLMRLPVSLRVRCFSSRAAPIPSIRRRILRCSLLRRPPLHPHGWNPGRWRGRRMRSRFIRRAKPTSSALPDFLRQLLRLTSPAHPAHPAHLVSTAQPPIDSMARGIVLW